MASEGKPVPTSGHRIPERSRRFLAEGRLRIESVTDEVIRAVFVADEGTVDLGFDLERGWWCSADATGLCVHLGALMLVTDVPGYREPGEPPPTIAPLPRRRDGGVAWILVAALAIVVAVLLVAYLLRGRPAPVPGGHVSATQLREARAKAATLQLRLADARSDIRGLRQELDVTQERLEAARHQLAAVKGQLESARSRVGALERRLRTVRGGKAPAGMVVISYRVRTGDTLWRLAEFFYGSGREFPRIVDANPEIRNPNVIHVGELLRVPVATTVPS